MNAHNEQQSAAAQEAVAWQINATSSNRGWENCTQECYDDTLRTGRYMGLPSGANDVQVRALYAAPVAAAPADTWFADQLTAMGEVIPLDSTPAAPDEMSPEFTDTARAAIAWVLWHHQGASSPVGQPLRFALGMGADEPLPDWRIAEAKHYAEWAGATTAKFHEARASTPAAPGIDLREIGEVMAEAEKHVETLHSLCSRPSVLACIKRLRKAQAALLDASPKGGTFHNDGNSEAQFIADEARLNCPSCGGSGHVEDSPKGALPALPDDFSESKDWRAGGYAERVEWLMDTVRSQRGHIDALLDSPEGGSEVRAVENVAEDTYHAIAEVLRTEAGWSVLEHVEYCRELLWEAQVAFGRMGANADTKHQHRGLWVKLGRCLEGYAPGSDEAVNALPKCDCENPEPPAGAALVSMTCPIHNDLPAAQAGDAEVQP